MFAQFYSVSPRAHCSRAICRDNSFSLFLRQLEETPFALVFTFTCSFFDLVFNELFFNWSSQKPIPQYILITKRCYRELRTYISHQICTENQINGLENPVNTLLLQATVAK